MLNVLLVKLNAFLSNVAKMLYLYFVYIFFFSLIEICEEDICILERFSWRT
jgi:hypothetical protein